jgi:hypothetical protein
MTIYQAWVGSNQTPIIVTMAGLIRLVTVASRVGGKKVSLRWKAIDTQDKQC